MNAVAEHVTTTTPPVRPRVQTRLRVGAVDDPLERQADEVAERVLRMPDPGPAMRRRSSDEPVIRRCPGGCPPTGCEESESTVQRLHDEGLRQPLRSFGGASTAHVPLAVHQTLRSPGRPLDARPREHMEARFGHRFDHVRVHTDDRAAKSAQAINARAYTVGNHIVFGSGTFAPGSATGRRLLAHELAHVLQQGGTGAAASPQPQAAPPSRAPQGAIVQRAEPVTTGAASVTITAVVAKCIIGAITGALFDAAIQSVLHSVRERTWRFWEARYDYCSIILSAIIGCIAGPVSAFVLEPWISAQLGARLGGIAGSLTGKILLFIAKKLGMAIPKSLVGTLAKLGCISPEQAAELDVRPGAEVPAVS